MKGIRASCAVALLLVLLAFWPTARSSDDAFGRGSRPEACRPGDQVNGDTLSGYWDTLRLYGFPPAWGNSNDGQQQIPTSELVRT